MSLLTSRRQRRIGWGTLAILATAWLLLALQPCAVAIAAAQGAPEPAEQTSQHCPDCQAEFPEPVTPTGCGDRLCHLGNPVSATSPEKSGNGTNTVPKLPPAVIWLLPPPITAPATPLHSWPDTRITRVACEPALHLKHCVFRN